MLAATHASGIDIINEIKISFKKSADKTDTMLLTDAPSTFRMPISLILFSADKTDNPNKPIQEIKMVSMALDKRICFHFASAA